MSKPWEIRCGDALTLMREMEPESVQCVVTSPPYWGLRDYGVPDQLGLERTPEEYVAKLVAVMREVRRVLRDDGVMFLNLGDSYASGEVGRHDARVNPNGPGATNKFLGTARQQMRQNTGLKPKDLVGIPWRVAFALQADGWWLRRDIIWHKRNCMPESVTDRPTSSHEYVFLLTKRERYYYDAAAIAEPLETDPSENYPGRARILGRGGLASLEQSPTGSPQQRSSGGLIPRGLTRNARSVWTIATEPFAEAHFATMPTELARRCILAGTSEKGCCEKCGAPWQREVDRTPMKIARSERTHELGRTRSSGTMIEPPSSVTLGWAPSCECEAKSAPCVVLDPFAGSGTTGVVALQNGRDFLGLELNPDYVAMAEKRIREQANPVVEQDGRLERARDAQQVMSL